MIIGVTGSIGAGKSTVAMEIASWGCIYFDADRVAKSLLPDVMDEIRARFGADLRAEDRAKIAERAFADRESWEALNAILHPHVIEAARRIIADADNVVLDVPLLFESGMDELCDKVVVVTADRDIRHARAAKFGDPERRERFQLSQEEKAARADFVIENSFSLEKVKSQILNLKSEILSTP